MYELFKRLGWQRSFTEQGPSLLSAGLIAELFYKFHSFTLECAAFLFTWFAIDLLLSLVLPARRRLNLEWANRNLKGRVRADMMFSEDVVVRQCSR